MRFRDHGAGRVQVNGQILMEFDTGYFDEVGDGAAKGWAIKSDDQVAAAALDILIDGEFAGEAIADLFREDLLEKDIRGGYAGFSFRIPIRYYDGMKHVVDVVQREPRRSLPDSPKEFTWAIADHPLLKEKTDWAERHLVVKHSPHARDLTLRVLRARRLAIMSTYHSAARFLSYHRDLIDSLTSMGYVVHIIHAGADFAPSLGLIERDDVFLTLKRNIGYDFGSWALGIYMHSGLLPYLDELLLLNDSIIGPLTDLAPLMDRVREMGADVVGLTDSFEKCYHLQSYFVWFGRAVCRSPSLQVFMAQYSFSSDKETVIQEGELGLTKFFLDAGFSVQAVFPYEAVAGAWLAAVPELVAGISALPVPDQDGARGNGCAYKDALFRRINAIVASVIEGEALNPTHFFWDILIERMGFPFFKREMLLVNPSAVPSYHRISEVLLRGPDRIKNNISELRRIYGGVRMPFFLPSADSGTPLWRAKHPAADANVSLTSSDRVSAGSNITHLPITLDKVTRIP